MTDEQRASAPANRTSATSTSAPPLPPVVNRATWQAQRDSLLAPEKARTREGDAIAAARRRLPMIEVYATTPLTGEHGPVPLLDVFEGRRQLIAYYHMWHDRQASADQCEGCTFFTGGIGELSYLLSRGVTYATDLGGPVGPSRWGQAADSCH